MGHDYVHPELSESGRFQHPQACSPMSTSHASRGLCLWVAGGKTGLPGRRLLHHTVQASWSLAYGPWAEQLQALGCPQPVCHSPEPLYQHHAGGLGRLLGVPLQGHLWGGVLGFLMVFWWVRICAGALAEPCREASKLHEN